MDTSPRAARPFPDLSPALTQSAQSLLDVDAVLEDLGRRLAVAAQAVATDAHLIRLPSPSREHRGPGHAC